MLEFLRLVLVPPRRPHLFSKSCTRFAVDAVLNFAPHSRFASRLLLLADSHMWFFRELQNFGFNGTIPSMIGNFSQLASLMLGMNNFSGPLSTSLFTLTNLRFLCGLV